MKDLPIVVGSKRSQLALGWIVLISLGIFAGRVQAQNVVLNEILADPAPGLAGDANGDGVRSATDDEFVEIVNVGNSTVDLSGWKISDSVKDRFTFPSGTSLDPGEFVVVFGGGTPTGIPGQVFTVSSGNLSLNNGGDTVTLTDAAGVEQDAHTYGSEGGDDQSLTRDPDGTGPFVQHTNATGSAGALFSPGTTVDGKTMLPPPDQTPPDCFRSNITATAIEITIQDPESGLLKIQVLGTVNAQVAIPLFAQGTNDPVVVVATKTDLSQSATVKLQASDVAGNATTCTFDLQLRVAVDIKPRRCPNPLSVENNAILSVAILGSNQLDVRDIDPSTVRLAGAAPFRHRVEDLSTPVPEGEACDCTTEGADGDKDLHLNFETEPIIAAVGSAKNGDEVVLTLTGKLKDGVAIEGKDCVLIRSKGLTKPAAFAENIPLDYALQENHPNPFNPETVIQFQLPEAAFVDLKVLNVLGQVIRTLVARKVAAGDHRVRWDGKDDAGNPVTSGVYFYHLKSEKFSQVKRMTLVR
ncbi:MAG: lamin tail domain-containing protein [bacterium]